MWSLQTISQCTGVLSFAAIVYSLIFQTCVAEVSLFILGSMPLPVGVVYSPFRTPLSIQFLTMWVCEIIKRSKCQRRCSLSSFRTSTHRSRCKRDSHYLFPCLLACYEHPGIVF